MTESLRSGQLAAAAAVNVQTLRYYERRGLLPHPQGSPIIETAGSWSSRYLDGARQDPLDAVVIDAVGAKEKQRSES